jgi:hypothetical protein
LLAVYGSKKVTDKSGLEDNFMADLDFGIGNLAPVGVGELFQELDRTSRNGKRAPSAAAALCRGGDVRAVEPLLRKVHAIERSDEPYPMSYAYALARLGRGDEARRFIARMISVTASERDCLNEIVEKFPSGGAPDSVCVLEGPKSQPENGLQIDQAGNKCLAARLPTPD